MTPAEQRAAAERALREQVHDIVMAWAWNPEMVNTDRLECNPLVVKITHFLLTREREARMLALEEAADTRRLTLKECEWEAERVLAECDCQNIAWRESAQRHVNLIVERIRDRAKEEGDE